MSAMENTAPICELPPLLVILRAWMRMRRANCAGPELAALTRSRPVELAHRAGDVVDVVERKHRVHRQHQTAAEKALGIGKRSLEAERGELVHRLAAPLEQRSDTLGSEVGAQRIALVRLDLVVLEHVEA